MSNVVEPELGLRRRPRRREGRRGARQPEHREQGTRDGGVDDDGDHVELCVNTAVLRHSGSLSVTGPSWRSSSTHGDCSIMSASFASRNIAEMTA
jgi:hypothetical protein